MAALPNQPTLRSTTGHWSLLALSLTLVGLLGPLSTLAHAGEGDAEPAAAESFVPAELPSFKVLDEKFIPVPTSRFKGKVMLLDFWASWCGPCLFTLPELERLHEEYGGRDDFAMVGFAIDRGRAGSIRARRFAEKHGVTYPIFQDDSSKPASPQFNVDAVPVLFLVAADGKILRRWDGEPEFSEVEAALKAALGIVDEVAESSGG